jgi:integrase-like protein
MCSATFRARHVLALRPHRGRQNRAKPRRPPSSLLTHHDSRAIPQRLHREGSQLRVESSRPGDHRCAVGGHNAGAFARERTVFSLDGVPKALAKRRDIHREDALLYGVEGLPGHGHGRSVRTPRASPGAHRLAIATHDAGREEIPRALEAFRSAIAHRSDRPRAPAPRQGLHPQSLQVLPQLPTAASQFLHRRKARLQSNAALIRNAITNRTPDRLLSHCVFPLEQYGQPGDEKPGTYDVDPTEPIGSWKTGWQNARTTSGVTCRFHDLRHSACTRLLEAGVSFPIVASLMGWSPSTTTNMAKRYGDIGNAAHRDAVRALDPATGKNRQNQTPTSADQQTGDSKAVNG